MTITEFLRRFEVVQKTSSGWDVSCPGHDDKRNPDLGVCEGQDGRILLKCRSGGCSTEAIVAALGLELRDLFPNSTAKRRQVATYSYESVDGEPLFQVVRFEPKDFRQRRRVDGRWVWNLGDVKRVLYRAPNVAAEAAAGGVVWIVEGEKDVAKLETAGVVATTPPGGAGKWRSTYTEQLRGCSSVIIVADADESGVKHAADVAASLAGAIPNVQIVRAANGLKDATDHFTAGYDLGDFEQVNVELAPPTLNGSVPITGGFDIRTWAEFRDTVEPEVQYLVRDLIPVGSVGFTAGGPKAGKTWLMLVLAISIVTGKQFLGRFTIPTRRPVVYLALEGDRSNLRDRIGALARGMDIDPDGADLNDLHLLWQRQRVDLRDVTLAGRLIPEIARRNPGLAVIDVLRKAATVRESGEGTGDFAEVLEAVTPLLDQGCAVDFGHHFAKVNDVTKKRDPGDRMVGSGSLHGHADFELLIVGGDRHERRYEIEYVTRNGAQLPEMKGRLIGHGSGRFGGFRYTDTARITIEVDGEATEAQIEQKRDAIVTWLAANPGRWPSGHVLDQVGGNRQATAGHLETLLSEGVLDEIAGPRKARMLALAATHPDVFPPPKNRSEQVGAHSPVPADPLREAERNKSRPIPENENTSDLADSVRHPE